MHRISVVPALCRTAYDWAIGAALIALDGAIQFIALKARCSVRPERQPRL